MTTPHSTAKVELTVTALFLVFPLTALSYLIWDLPGLFLGVSMGALALGILALFQKNPSPSLSREVVKQRGAPHMERELLFQREEELALLEQRFFELEEFARDKRDEVDHLKGQVEGLKGEIRRLLDLDPIQEEVPQRAPEEEVWTDTFGHSARREVMNRFDAHSLLKQSFELAESLKGVRHLAGRSKRFEALSMGNYAIDLRQLFEAFREETGGVIAIYSPKEERLLFVSNLIRGLLGWGPERFIRDFNWLVRRGENEWQEAAGTLTLGEEAHLEMIFRSASDEEIEVGCALGPISRGAFTGLVVAVLYPLSQPFNE